MKYLITGGAGFIGSHIVEQLINLGDDVTIIDNFDETLRPATSRREWLALMQAKERFTFIEEDLVNLNLREMVGNLDFVIHQAATPGLLPSWTAFEQYLHNNVLATKKLAEAVASVTSAGKSQLKKIVHASTSSVYGAIADRDESQQPNPISPYGISKLASEQIWSAYAPQIEPGIVILRYFSVYGPRQREDMAWSRFIRAISAGEPIEVTGTGEQKRSATYVGDVVSATLAAANLPSAKGIYNICGNQSISVNEAISIIEDILAKTAQRVHSESRSGDQLHTEGVNRKAKAELHFENRFSIKDGLHAQVKDYLNG